MHGVGVIEGTSSSTKHIAEDDRAMAIGNTQTETLVLIYGFRDMLADRQTDRQTG